MQENRVLCGKWADQVCGLARVKCGDKEPDLQAISGEETPQKSLWWRWCKERSSNCGLAPWKRLMRLLVLCHLPSPLYQSSRSEKINWNSGCSRNSEMSDANLQRRLNTEVVNVWAAASKMYKLSKATSNWFWARQDFSTRTCWYSAKNNKKFHLKTCTSLKKLQQQRWCRSHRRHLSPLNNCL